MSTKRRLALKKRASNTEILQQDTGSKYCRTCLATEDLKPIFSKENGEKRSQDLKLITGLEIKMNDGLSQNICSQCADVIKSYLQFRRTSKKAERALRGMVSGTMPKVKKKYRLQKPVPTELIKTEMEMNVEVVPVETDYNYDDDYGTEYQDYSCEIDRPTVIKKEVTRKKREVHRAPTGGYKCGTCHKEFRMKATFKAHMRFHTNFCVCEACGKRCRNNNQLQEHKRARHGLGRIHKCAYCDYSSATKEALTIHERRHTGERPYVCDHCGAAFHRRSNLVQHIAIHLPDKNWQCDMCPKRLKSKKFLQIHKHNAHTGKRYGYLCGVCSHRFEKPNKVRAHTRRVHGLPDDQQAPITRVQL